MHSETRFLILYFLEGPHNSNQNLPSFHSLKWKFYLSFFILLPCEQKLPLHDMYWLAKKVSSSNNYSIFHHSSASFII